MTDACYLDTTILIEALFKTRERRRKARAAIRGYAKSMLPVYAIKEMTAGALSYIIWLHNRLAESRSLATAYGSIAANRRAQNRVFTSLEALQVANESLVGTEFAEATTPAETDRLQADMLAISLRRLILRGWRERRNITTEVVQELDCFPEESPFFDEELGKIRLDKKGCEKDRNCHYAPAERQELPLRPGTAETRARSSITPESD